MNTFAARKRSEDPAQEALRESKALWNKQVSAFIDNLIHVKKMLNGWPSKFHMEKAKITEPLPKDPTTILGVLAGDFRDIAVKGNSIIEHQIAYSQTRRKKQPGVGTPPAPPPAPAPVTASLEELNDELTINSSNVLTRFFSKLKGPYFGKDIEAKTKRYRNNLLDSSADVYKLCSKFQEQIVGSGTKSITEANKTLAKIEDLILKITKSIDAAAEDIGYENLSVKKPLDKLPKEEIKPQEGQEGQESEKNQPSKKDSRIDAALAAAKDVGEYIFNFPQVATDPITINIIKYAKYFIESAEKDRSKVDVAAALKLLAYYEKLIAIISNEVGQTGSSLGEITRNILTKKSASDQLNVVAQAFIKKWIGKTRHSLPFSDSASALRVSAYEYAENMREILEGIMNSLEEDLDFEFIQTELNSLTTKFFSIQKAINAIMPEMKYLGPSSVFDQDNTEQLNKAIQQKHIREMARRLSDNPRKY